MFENLYKDNPNYNFVIAHAEIDYLKPDIPNCDGEKIVQEDLDYGYKIGVSGTPTFVIFTKSDTALITGAPPDYEVLKNVLLKRFKIDLK